MRIQQLLLMAILVLSSLGAHALNTFDLVTKSCRFYPGLPLQTYMDPQTGGYHNPLLASPIGQLSYWPNFKKSALEFDYRSPDLVVQAITKSPDLDRALDVCYGSNQDAKVNFLFFLGALPVEAKADAFVLTAVSFVFVEGALGQVAARLPFLAALARTGTAMRVIAAVVVAEASYVSLKAFVRYIQFRRHTLHDHEVAQMKLVDQEQKVEAAKQIAAERKAVQEMNDFALRDLTSNIAALKAKVGTIQDPARRAQLEDLIAKSEQTLRELKAS